MIIDSNLKRPEDNYEAISMLFEQKVLSDKLAQTLTKMVGLRNILVHEYGKIDRKKVYEVLCTQLQDLEEFKNSLLGILSGRRFEL